MAQRPGRFLIRGRGRARPWGRNIWRTTKGVAQWPGNSEAHSSTITGVFGATGMLPKNTWGPAPWQSALRRKTPSGAPSTRQRPRPGVRNGLHSMRLTSSSTPTGTQQPCCSRRHSTQKDSTSMTEAHGASILAQDEIKALLKKAAKGDKAVLPTLRQWMDRTSGYWEAMGDLAKVAREALIEHASGGKNLLAQESLTRKCAALTQELMGVTPSPIERLLVERIVMCWLQLYYTECIYVLSLESSLTLQQAE